MSRPSHPGTPLTRTPTLYIPSPTRTPSPLPLFSTGGPYSYTGQIARKYAARFNEINKTKNIVKDVDGAWEKEAKEKGLPLEELMKNGETEFTWDDKSVPRLNLPEPMNHNEERSENDDETTFSQDKRLSLEEDHFVDALTSPIEKPKDWDDRLSRNEKS